MTWKRSPRLPFLSTPLGPSALPSSSSDENSSSTSTGVCTRDVGMSAPLVIRGPPVYGGLSWTKRSLTTLAAVSTASAPAGSFWSLGSDISTATSRSPGVIFVILPTGTPRMSTWLPT